MKSMTKKQIAEKMGISSGTSRKYLNERWYHQLSELGYEKEQRLLSVNQVNLIVSIWGDLEDPNN